MRTKYPIVLVHGTAARDAPLLISFWGRIPAVLRRNGIRVYLGKTDSWGSCSSNAAFLKSTIDGILERSGCGKVNIIAHSKGGIDARYLISSLGYASKITSLTTVSTPHHGSELADLVVNRRMIGHPIMKHAMKALQLVYGDRNPDPEGLAFDLTTRRMNRFNEDNPDSADVYYRSFYSIMKNATDDLSFFLTYRYLRSVAGANDGIVSARSTKWGASHTLITGAKAGISHGEIVDYKKRCISGVDIPRVYLGMAETLSTLGL